MVVEEVQNVRHDEGQNDRQCEAGYEQDPRRVARGWRGDHIPWETRETRETREKEGEGRRRKEKEGGARKEMETRNEGTRHEHDTEE
jgi:hypothetical protein